MNKVSNIFVSGVLVLDERAKNSSLKVKTLAKILRANYANYEAIIVDNGIPEAEFNDLSKLLKNIPCVRILRLSRVHDTDTALFAGLEAAIGDYVCTLYNEDPIDLLPEFVRKAQTHSVVFGIAQNLKRSNKSEELGARLFYWYSKRFLKIDIPYGSTYFMCMNRSAANALTRSGRFMRHIRHMSKRVGFSTISQHYELPPEHRRYAQENKSTMLSRAIDLVSNYSNHPLRVLSYFGLFAGIVNIIYAVYVVGVNLSNAHIEKGWTTLSLQSSFMFFVLFMILAALAEYIGKILNEVQHEPPYHIMQELSSVISIADESRRNVIK